MIIIIITIIIIIIIIITIIRGEEETKQSKTKQEEKIDKYQDLAREIRSLWKVKAKVIPIVIGALGTIPKGLNGYLKEIGVTTRVELLQKSALLGTARTLRMVLET